MLLVLLSSAFLLLACDQDAPRLLTTEGLGLY